jgi:ABC-type multidrug transport system fused ATPase/permease subunit
MWYGASLVASGEMSVGELVSFVLYTTFIGGSIAGLGDIYSQLQKAIGSSERVVELLAEEEEAGAGEQIVDFKGNIEFEEVGFHYPTRPEVEVLQGLSFQIQSGEKVALVGPSGAGKSTIIQLLLRFYEATKGQIRIDGQPLTHWELASLRSKIGIVPQEVLLFGGSIRENIAYAKPDATDQEVVEAATKANIHAFIDSLPEKYATFGGEKGTQLSGGQKQRIAIARAILKNPTILILDEATSALDSESERLVQEALEKLMEGRTSIIIAHRLSTIRNADQILVMQQGQIIERGKHEELISHEGVYSELVQLQRITSEK